MHEGLKSMLAAYSCKSAQDYQNALKEIVQEIALLGLWRAKFFEHAAFYGGSALRILHGLDRFSEDLDFSLLWPEPAFELKPFLGAIESELGSFGFRMTVATQEKTGTTPIRRAFIKANTRMNLLTIETPPGITATLHREQILKVKLEVDIDPPPGAEFDARLRLLPIPFSVKTFALPDLFAGKMSAVLCRQWKDHVKGRDWYDFVWFVSRNIPLRLNYCASRLAEQGAWSESKSLTVLALADLLKDRIKKTDFASARADVLPFVKDAAAIELWSEGFMNEIADRIKTV